MRSASKVLWATVCLALAGCGTINTVMREEGVAARELKNEKTYCQSIPRVYSGVGYNFCRLNGDPNPNGAFDSHVNFVPFVFVDALISGVLDTALLPYTIYRQSNDGSIIIR
ncbi:YceK/YidQ family lipoprotein [Pseudomonas fluorescens]